MTHVVLGPDTFFYTTHDKELYTQHGDPIMDNNSILKVLDMDLYDDEPLFIISTFL